MRSDKIKSRLGDRRLKGRYEMSSYVNNYNTMHTKFQSRDNYGEGCRQVIARASGTQIEIPDDTAWGESNERYFDALLKTEHQLVQAKGNVKTHCKIVRTLDRATAREYKSSPRRKSSDAKRTSSGDSGDSESDQPPSPPGLAHLLPSSYLITHTHQKNSSLFSWQSTPGNCRMSGGGQR
jgi:hypothetical protein